MLRYNSIFSTIQQSLAVIILAFFITLGLSTRAQAQGPVILTDEQDEYPLGLHLEILEDPTGQLTIETVSSPEFDQQFVRNQTSEFNLGLTDSVYWIRFQVRNQTRQTNEWWLESAAFEIDNVSVYYLHPDDRPGFAMKQGGNAFPAARWETDHYHPAFKLPLSPQSEQTIYMRIDSRRINLPLTLWSGAGFIRERQKDFMILGLYLGVLFIMAGYNFFLFLALRDKSYLYYVLFMVGVLLVEILRKYSPQGFLWPNLIWVNKSHIYLFIFTLVLIFLFQFVASFLMTKVHTPQLHRTFIGLQIGLGIAGILFLLWREITLFLTIWLVLVLLTAATIFTTGLIIWWRGYRVARYFVLALALLLGSFFLSILAVLGFLPISYTEYIGEIGIVLMALLMSLALADRINIIKQEREAAQRVVVQNQQEMLLLKDDFTASLQQTNEELTRNIAQREQAEAEIRQRNRELTLLNQVIAATTDTMDLETVLETTCRELAQALDLTHASAVLANEDKSAIKIVADYRAEDQLSIVGQSLPVKDNPLLEYLATHNVPLAAEDAQNDPRLASVRHLLRLRDTISVLMLPLVVEKEIVGGFSLGSNKPRRFSADELNLAQNVAEQVARALVRVHLAEERQRLEAQLLQAQKMEAIGRLAGGIAHDFNNILVPIIGYVELGMMELSPDDSLYTDLQQVQQAAERAAGLTRQILAFSRRQMLEMQVLDLNTVVTDFKKMIQRLIGEDIELQTSLPSDIYRVKADQGQIEQVLLNLVINARDAMPQGGKLTIETANAYLDEAYVEKYADAQPPGYYAMLAVSDTGHGMDAETQQKIFEPFFTTKEQGKGTGLGLATVFGIVKQHGGNIWVYSEPGSGTTFKIYLPQAEEAVQPHEPPATEPASVYGSETVLVVEDEEMVRKLVCETLTVYGYKVLEAQSVNDGLRLASQHKTIHLLLTDVIMPNMNGIELTQKVAEIHPSIKILYMSGYTDNVIVHHGILDKGVNFLQKPFTVRSLTRKVRQVLG